MTNQMEYSAIRDEMATVTVLVRRDVVRFLREKTRIVGALLQPLLFWVIVGTGMSPVFRLPGNHSVSYGEYFFPGIVIMVVLFTSIFATMSIIDDRHNGFLQGVLVAPGSRASMVIGKSLGATVIALIQASLFLLLAPFAGFSVMHLSWPLLLLALVLCSFALSTLGFAVAWWLDSVQGYHVIMSIVLLPAWILSGAVFPVPTQGWLHTLVLANPLTYAVSLVRIAMYGGAVQSTHIACNCIWTNVAVLIAFALMGAALAGAVSSKRRN